MRVSLRRVSEILDDAGRSAGARRTPCRCRRSRGDVDVRRRHAVASTAAAGARAAVVRGRVPARCVAIVGPSGSGKSTIADLLLRLLDPDSGVDSARRPRPARSCGWTICAGTSRSSIRSRACCTRRSPRTSATRGRTRPTPTCARRRGGRRSTAFIGRLPQGYDTIVGERGHGAVGRRAAADRASRARFWWTRRCWSSTSRPRRSIPDRERQVVEGYEAVMRGRTTIVITHRLELARRANRVLTLSGARIVEPVF